jgi:antagonist of KipI
MGIIVRSAGFFTTVQDLGRFGYQRYGVSPVGPMDWLALRIANHVVGNSAQCAGLEFTLTPPVLQADADLIVAAAGSGFDLIVQDRPVGLWMAALVRRGEFIYFTPRGEGGWVYLAVSGGITTPVMMGSRSTDGRARLGGVGGKPVQEGDRLPVGEPAMNDFLSRAGCSFRPDLRPNYREAVILPVIPGPQEQMFPPEGRRVFYESAYTIAPTSDRSGYRLAGPHITQLDSSELLSEGMALGSVQVPADGQPIVMMSDHPTTGGYPKIATAALVGLPFLAQQPIGSGVVQFKAVSVVEAQQAYRQVLMQIERGIDEVDD